MLKSKEIKVEKIEEKEINKKKRRKEQVFLCKEKQGLIGLRSA